MLKFVSQKMKNAGSWDNVGSFQDKLGKLSPSFQ